VHRVRIRLRGNIGPQRQDVLDSQINRGGPSGKCLAA
jgi:hypothetical protein